jgi:hypothetical protein
MGAGESRDDRICGSCSEAGAFAEYTVCAKRPLVRGDNEGASTFSPSPLLCKRFLCVPNVCSLRTGLNGSLNLCPDYIPVISMAVSEGGGQDVHPNPGFNFPEQPSSQHYQPPQQVDAFCP